ncbi:MAG: hypothetical protein WCJ64_00500 [Rhodospirillaceae bacterium]
MFSSITAAAPVIIDCPKCRKQVWSVTNEGIESDGRTIADDGDTIRMRMPHPLTAWTQIDQLLLVGTCHHCGQRYWYAEAAYPSVPVANWTIGTPQFNFDEQGGLSFSRVNGTFHGTDQLPGGGTWYVVRYNASWQGAEIIIDQHIVGLHVNGKSMIGGNGVSSCGGNAAIWSSAAKLVEMITPKAVAFLAESRAAS